MRFETRMMLWDMAIGAAVLVVLELVAVAVLWSYP